MRDLCNIVLCVGLVTFDHEKQVELNLGPVAISVRGHGLRVRLVGLAVYFDYENFVHVDVFD